MSKFTITYTLILVAIGAILILSSCAIVHVRVDDQDDIKLSLWPLGVRVTAQAGAADGVYVKVIGAGIVIHDRGFSLATIQKSEIFSVDADVCALALVKPDREISNQEIARYQEAGALCTYFKTSQEGQ